MEKFETYLTFENLFTLRTVFYLLLFIIYELGYKILVVNKLEWRVKREISKEQTEIQENIKGFYNEKLERQKAENLNENNRLKNALDKLLSLQLQHRTEERQALLSFLSNCNQWIFNLYRIKFDNYAVDNIGDLKLKVESIQDEYFLNIHAERIKILLFMREESVAEATNELVNTLKKYKIDMENVLTDLLILLKQQYNSRYEYTDVFEDIGEAIVTAYSIDNREKIGDLFLEFENFNGRSFGNCMNQIENFTAIAKSYLASLEFATS